MTYETLTWEVDGDGIATLTLDRPESLNAFDLSMARELERVFLTDARDDAVRAVVVTGAGRAFCAGMDLSADGNVFGLDESVTPTPEDLRAHLTEAPYHDGVRDTGGRVTLAIHALPKPVIAAINGAAVGIGATMTLAMDLRLASTQARIGFVFGRLGIVPEACSSWFLPRIVGIQQALEWVYSGGGPHRGGRAGRAPGPLRPRARRPAARGPRAGPHLRRRPVAGRPRSGQAAALPQQRRRRAARGAPVRLARDVLDLDRGRPGGSGGVPGEAVTRVHRPRVGAAAGLLSEDEPPTCSVTAARTPGLSRSGRAAPRRPRRATASPRSRSPPPRHPDGSPPRGAAG